MYLFQSLLFPVYLGVQMFGVLAINVDISGVDLDEVVYEAVSHDAVHIEREMVGVDEVPSQHDQLIAMLHVIFHPILSRGIHDTLDLSEFIEKMEVCLYFWEIKHETEGGLLRKTIFPDESVGREESREASNQDDDTELSEQYGAIEREECIYESRKIRYEREVDTLDQK